MKKIKLWGLILISFFLFNSRVLAATGKITVTGSSTVVVKNTVTVTVTLSSNTSIGSWQMDLKYDKSYLQLTKSSAEENGTSMVGAASSDGGIKKKTYTFTFRALKTGSTNISITGYEAYEAKLTADGFPEISLTASSKNIKIITQEELEASYSKNNDLSALSLEEGEITPSFSKDVLEYGAVVAENTKEITINATASDSKSSITGAGKHEVTSGTNTFEIVVRAENGAEKTYKINVEVKDANPINVDINGESYTVVKLRENLPNAQAYMEDTITIDGFDIPCYTSEFTNLTLVGLKNSVGNINLYIYEDNKYTLYQEIGLNKVTIYPIDTEEVLEGYTKKQVEINGIKVEGYTFSDTSRFIVFYGINIENGEKDFYLYDKNNQSLNKYNDEYINVLLEQNRLYTYIIFGFSGILFLLIIILIIISSKGKKKKKKKEESMEEIIDQKKKAKKKKAKEK